MIAVLAWPAAAQTLSKDEGHLAPTAAKGQKPISAYQDVLLAQLKISPDPVILSVSGTWHVDGTVVIESMDEYPNGRASRLMGGGDGAIVLLDEGGTVLQSTAVELPPCRGFDGEENVLESDECSIGIRLSYPQETAVVQFRERERVLLSVDPLSMSLRSIVLALPDQGYEKNPAERRKALLEKIDALEKLVGAKKYRPAIEKLENDIRDKIEKWTVDYHTGSAPAILKADVLALIDRTIQRLRLRESRQAPPPYVPSS